MKSAHYCSDKTYLSDILLGFPLLEPKSFYLERMFVIDPKIIGLNAWKSSRVGISYYSLNLMHQKIFFKGAQVGGRTWDLFFILVYFLSQAAP